MRGKHILREKKATYVEKKIETLRFSRLNERNVSLVAICAVI